MDDQPVTVGRAKPRVRRWRAPLVLLSIVLVAAVGSAGYWYLTRDEESTDDAYTDGRAVTLAPQVAGLVVALHVTDNQHVNAGEPLLEIDPTSYTAARDAAAASLQSVEAQLDTARLNLATARINYPARLEMAQAALAAAKAAQFKAQADAKRQQSLPKAATTQQDVDTATANRQSADAQAAQADAQLRQADQVGNLIDQAAAQVKQLEAQVALAHAQLDQATLNLSWTRVTAPQEGWITRRNVEQGNYVQAGQALLALVTPEVWITANFKESQLERMRAGQRVQIDVDAYPSLHLTGHLDSIQLGSGSRFTAFPPENATGNYVKIVQRVPVKIVIDGGLPAGFRLPLGLSVTPVVQLR
jgi:membrane fusion protein (multidrug efflux system)